VHGTGAPPPLGQLNFGLVARHIYAIRIDIDEKGLLNRSPTPNSRGMQRLYEQNSSLGFCRLLARRPCGVCCNVVPFPNHLISMTFALMTDIAIISVALTSRIFRCTTPLGSFAVSSGGRARSSFMSKTSKFICPIRDECVSILFR
jgi:hypothetical protein